MDSASLQGARALELRSTEQKRQQDGTHIPPGSASHGCSRAPHRNAFVGISPRSALKSVFAVSCLGSKTVRSLRAARSYVLCYSLSRIFPPPPRPPPPPHNHSSLHCPLSGGQLESPWTASPSTAHLLFPLQLQAELGPLAVTPQPGLDQLQPQAHSFICSGSPVPLFSKRRSH